MGRSRIRVILRQRTAQQKISINSLWVARNSGPECNCSLGGIAPQQMQGAQSAVAPGTLRTQADGRRKCSHGLGIAPKLRQRKTK